MTRITTRIFFCIILWKNMGTAILDREATETFGPFSSPAVVASGSASTVTFVSALGFQLDLGAMFVGQGVLNTDLLIQMIRAFLADWTTFLTLSRPFPPISARTVGGLPIVFEANYFRYREYRSDVAECN